MESSDKEVALKTETQPKRVIVDIGAGIFPYPAGREQRKLKENEIYVGIEPKLKDIEAASKILKAPEILGKGKAHLAMALGETLPLKDNSADEVVIANLFGFFRPAAVQGRLEERLKTLVKETARILRGKGIVHIVETYSPYEEPGKIIDFFKTYGLSFRKKTEDKDEIANFSAKGIMSRGSYMLEFAKGD